MKRSRKLFTTMAAAALVVGGLHWDAAAGGRGIRGGSAASLGRAVAAGVRGASHASRGSGRGLGLGSALRSGSGPSKQQIGQGLRGAARWLNNNYGDRGGYYGGHHGYYDNDMADAYRDAALANAAVGLVGVLVNAHVQQQALRTAPVAVAAPVVVQPTGQYATQRTLVRDGYWQEQQVWVPDQYDPGTGATILGHYATQRVWVPPVYQETQVYVPAAAPAPVSYGGGYAYRVTP